MRESAPVHHPMDVACYDTVIRQVVPDHDLLLSHICASLPAGCRNILELGCGTGLLTGRLRESCPGARICAVDISPRMVEVASQKEELRTVTFLVRDIRDSWPEGPFDAVVSSLCLHHLSSGERETIATRSFHALAPGGRFVCGDIFRAESPDVEQILCSMWVQKMHRAGASPSLIEAMLRERTGRLPLLSTIRQFSLMMERVGFSPVFLPCIACFVSLAVGIIPGGGGDSPRGSSLPEQSSLPGADLCRP